jgi:acetyl esterase/lipase
MGGGATWSHASSEPDDSQFHSTAAIDSIDCAPAAAASALGGIINPLLPDNPVNDDTYIFVPYCTQDLHWGAGNSVTYLPDGTVKVEDGTGDDPAIYDQGSKTTLSVLEPSNPRVRSSATVFHNGMNNAASVLSYVFEEFTSPERVLVTGCSAGAYAALAYGAKVKDHYSSENTKVVIVPDSGMGAVTPDFAATGLGFWGVECALQACGLRAGMSGLLRKAHTMDDLWQFIAGAYPDMPIGHFTSTADYSQVDHYHEMRSEIYSGADKNVSAADWKVHVLGLLDKMTNYPNFASFVTSGTGHCTGAFSEATKDPTFLPWLNDVMAWVPPANLESKKCDDGCDSATTNGCDGLPLVRAAGAEAHGRTFTNVYGRCDSCLVADSSNSSWESACDDTPVPNAVPIYSELQCSARFDGMKQPTTPDARGESGCCACKAEETCTDRAGWSNGQGPTCDTYKTENWCQDGKVVEDWTAGSSWNYPEAACCACGGGVKSGAASACADTPDWTNVAGRSDTPGCLVYVAEGWCKDGAIAGEHAWTGGGYWNHPEDNCCACGKH